MTKTGTPPKTLRKKGDRAFHQRRRPYSPANRLRMKICSVCRAPLAPSNHPAFVFSRVYNGCTRVIKSGVWPSTPFFECLREDIPRRPQVWEVPFFARCGLMCPGRAQKHRRLATVSGRGGCGTTKRLRPTSRRPTAQIHSNVISMRDQHAAGLGSVITAYHDESRLWVLTPMSCSSRAAPSAPYNADTDKEDSCTYTSRVARVAV